MSAINRTVLERLRSTVGDDMFAELLDEFVRDSARLQKELCDAVQARDVEATKHCAHELKGLAVLFGAPELAKACTRADRDGDFQQALLAVELCAAVRASLTQATQEPATGVA